MATFKSFEEIEAWQKARILADKLFWLSQAGGFSKDYKLKDQINGSSGSIMDNIAEGYERDGSKEFRQFLAIAKGSAGEVRSQLYRALDRHHLPEDTYNALDADVNTIGKLIGGLIKYLNRSVVKGKKYQ